MPGGESQAKDRRDPFPEPMLEVRLQPDQLQQLACMIAAEMRSSGDGPVKISEAAEILRRSPDTIRRRIKAGQIKTVPHHPGLIPRNEINRLLQ